MRTSRKKKFSEFTEAQAFRALQIKHLLPWDIEYTPRAPSAFYHENMRRLRKHFALSGSEEAKKLLIDAVCEEAMEGYDRLKIWKAAKLETETMTNTSDSFLKSPIQRVVSGMSGAISRNLKTPAVSGISKTHSRNN